VLAVGNPLGYSQTVTFGIVSTLGRGLPENGPATYLPDLIQTSAPINPGNSGGALVDLSGNLVGVPTLAAQDPQQGGAAQGIGFAIPANRVRFITDQIVKTGKVINTGRAYLGVSGQDVSSDVQQQYNLPADHGVLLARVGSGTPAAKAGLRAGDIIVQVGDTTVSSNADLLDALARLQPGQSTRVGVVGCGWQEPHRARDPGHPAGQLIPARARVRIQRHWAHPPPVAYNGRVAYVLCVSEGMCMCLQPILDRRARTRSIAHRWAALSLFALLGSLAWPPLARSAASGPAAIGGLHVSGNQLLNGAGQPIVLHGVDRSGSEYACIQGSGFFDGPSDAASVRAIAAWHTNAVRVPLNEDCWLGINGAPAAYSGAAYQAAIAAYVDLLNQNGLVAILDLHWTAAGSSQATGQTQMADADHAPAFWTSVAGTFKSHGSVVFDLYNEPHDISWACWRDGGPGCGTGYTVAGMQSMVDAVRGTGATNVLMLGGLAYANDLSQWLAYRPTDPQHNLIAAWHVYNFNSCNNAGCYDSHVAPVAQQVPLVAGEIGETDCAHSFVDGLMGWLDAHAAGYVGWAWNTQDCASFPSLISDYSGTPTNFGIGLKDHLAALAGGGPIATPTSTSAAPTATSTLATGTSTAPASATVTPAATNTNTPAPATSTNTATPNTGGGGVAAGGSIAAGTTAYWGEDDVVLSNAAPLTALTVTVVVLRTPGIDYAGQYTTFPGGIVTATHTVSAGQILYTYTLVAGQTLPPGTWRIGSSYSGNGTPHPAGGDSYAVTATGGGTTSLGGGFSQDSGSATNTPTATNTPLPASATNTPVPPSATSTPIAPTSTLVSPSATVTATSTQVPATAGPISTPVPATATSTSTPNPGGGNGVLASGSLASGTSPYWGEEDLHLVTTASLSALTITITVARTAGIAFAGQYTNLPGGALVATHSQGDDQLTFTYNLASGQTLPVGSSGLIGSQYSGNGTPHPTGGDTYTVIATSGGVTSTQGGHF